MGKFVCPLCGSDSVCNMYAGSKNGYHELTCDTYKVQYELDDSVLYLENDEEKKNKLLDLVVEELVRHPSCTIDGKKDHWRFCFKSESNAPENDMPEFVNLADRLANYPSTIMERMHRGLLNLSYYSPRYGDTIYCNDKNRRLLMERDNNSFGRVTMARFLEELGYLERVNSNFPYYIITIDGWQKIDELRKNEQVLKQGFIAMQFGDETKNIREAFRTAIRKSGYTERFIDEKEHNHQIVPEIFFEIERSRFVVVDITYPNYGAYYEAGYAQALGKEVIICCNKDVFDSKDKKDRPHFDIAQKSMIVWTDEEDLIKRLKRRIEATVQ